MSERCRRTRLQMEKLNIATHALGALLALVATGFLIAKGYGQASWLAMVAYGVYGLSMLALYGSSTIYHCFRGTPVGNKLQILDHIGIFLLIAGTYTPVALLVIGGFWGKVLVALVWALALAGSIMKLFFLEASKKLSTMIYLLMGWLVLLFLKPLIESISLFAFLFILAGGIVYSLGTIFYKMKARPWAHGVWHAFVLAGSALMFVGIFFGS